MTLAQYQAQKVLTGADLSACPPQTSVLQIGEYFLFFFHLDGYQLHLMLSRNTEVYVPLI